MLPYKYIPFFSGCRDLSKDSPVLTFEDLDELSDSPDTLCAHLVTESIHTYMAPYITVHANY